MTDNCGTGKTATAAPAEPTFELRASDPLAPGLVQLWVALKAQDFEEAIATFAMLCQLWPGDMDSDSLAAVKVRAEEMVRWYAAGGDAERFQASLDQMNDGELGGSGVPGDA